MFDGLVPQEQIHFYLVFFEGLLSFFSPCVIPLIPIYIGYLAGNAKQTGPDGSISYRRGKVFLHTVFFVLGISFAFFVLGLSFSALGVFFKSNRLLLSRIGGILIILLGLVQIGFFDLKFLQREHKLHLKADVRRMNPLLAFLMGFTFSFAWTPCVGPALSSVLILASSSGSALTGNLLVLVYSLGFVIPFLLLGLFTTQALGFLKRNQKLLKYTIKAGGVLLILMGIMTLTGFMNGISSYLSSFTGGASQTSSSQTSSPSSSQEASSETPPSQDASSQDASAPSDVSGDSAPAQDTPAGEGQEDAQESESAVVPAFDFTLTDQYGVSHTLSDYKGKVVFLNFWATWCPPCKQEMPHIQELYEEYGKNENDVVILGLANPKTAEHPQNADVSTDEVKKFLTDNGYSFPVVFDETSDTFRDYFISVFPTTFMIDKEGNIYGYATGGLTKDIMKNIIEKTREGTR